jgi:four helix bundle protein
VATVQRFEELEIWRLARCLAKDIYLVVGQPTFTKEFRLKDQMKGSCGSIMDNIAEGFERDSRLEFINFLSYAKGSAGELKSQLHRSFDAGLINNVEFAELYEKVDKVGNKMGAFIRYLNGTPTKGTKFKGRMSS